MEVFAYRLCATIGIEDPSYLTINAEQFLNWIRYWEVEPFGDMWRPLAIQSMLIASANSKKRWKIDDFMPTRKKQSAQEMTAVLMQFAKLHNKVVKNG